MYVIETSVAVAAAEVADIVAIVPFLCVCMYVYVCMYVIGTSVAVAAAEMADIVAIVPFLCVCMYMYICVCVRMYVCDRDFSGGCCCGDG